MMHLRTHRFRGDPRSIIRTIGHAAITALMVTMFLSVARAQPAPLPDKPFAEHRIVLQLSDNDPRKEGLVVSVAYNLLKLYGPDKAAIEVVAFGPGIDLLNLDNTNRKRVESLVAQGVRFDVCLNTVDTIERETGKRPEFIPAATPVQVGVGQILALTENGYTLVRP
jgi:intracellular sulfur oxidation DsrE/DsrF family protein